MALSGSTSTVEVDVFHPQSDELRDAECKDSIADGQSGEHVEMVDFRRGQHFTKLEFDNATDGENENSRTGVCERQKSTSRSAGIGGQCDSRQHGCYGEIDRGPEPEPPNKVGFPEIPGIHLLNSQERSSEKIVEDVPTQRKGEEKSNSIRTFDSIFHADSPLNARTKGC